MFSQYIQSINHVVKNNNEDELRAILKLNKILINSLRGNIVGGAGSNTTSSTTDQQSTQQSNITQHKIPSSTLTIRTSRNLSNSNSPVRSNNTTTQQVKLQQHKKELQQTINKITDDIRITDKNNKNIKTNIIKTKKDIYFLIKFIDAVEAKIPDDAMMLELKNQMNDINTILNKY